MLHGKTISYVILARLEEIQLLIIWRVLKIFQNLQLMISREMPLRLLRLLRPPDAMLPGAMLPDAMLRPLRQSDAMLNSLLKRLDLMLSSLLKRLDVMLLLLLLELENLCHLCHLCHLCYLCHKDLLGSRYV